MSASAGNHAPPQSRTVNIEPMTSAAPISPRPATNKKAPSASPSGLERRTPAPSQPRPGSSASPRLVRKTSRSSLGSPRPEDDSQKHPTPKRSISNLITELRGAHSAMESIPEPVVLTAPQIAEACFARELASHESASSKTIVLLHDACYGHRFSRLRTSKGTLGMIVERPERILASVLGIAGAYVRTGGYHAGARNAPHPKRAFDGPPPFKIRRTNRVLELRSTYVTNVHGTEWMTELDGMCNLAEQKLNAGEKEVSRKDDSKRSLHEGDLYLCKESLDAFQGALGGVADAVDAVFDPSVDTARAFVAVRPPGHHCSADHPSGFCWINNVHVGIEYAAQAHGLTHAAIIDFDLHHGDGSQSIAWERNSSNNYKRLYGKANSKLKLAPDVGYYSLHDINSYPCEMGDDEKVQAASLCIHNAHGQSIWNVHLQPWKTTEEFWKLYETRYLILLEKATEFLKYHFARLTLEGKQRPKSAIFISAGFDASEWEGEGMQRHKVSVPTDFYARFTEDIMKVAELSSTGCDGRVISVLEGGYSDRALCSSTLSHLSALATYGQKVVTAPIPNGLGASMQAGGLDTQMRSLSLSHTQGGYDTAWWSADNLTTLEHHVNPPPPISAGGKKMRVGPQPTYATPTESFAYKVIDPAKFARSVSGTMREGPTPSRPLTPPPPDVDWVIATHELSKLLTPSHRTTRSCTAEDLAVKKERTSDIGLAPSPDELGKPRQLRVRGAGKPAVAERKVSSGDRRKTMGDFKLLTLEDPEPLVPVQARKTSRRSSMASTTSTVSALHDATVPPVPALPTAGTRPGPVRTPSEGMHVKKMRPPIVNAAAAVKPKTVTPRAPRSPSKKAVAAAMLDTQRTPQPIQSSSPVPVPSDLSSPVDSEVASVDALATGMKRITLKVSSREESEKKAKEKLDADRRARALKAAETRRINKAAKEAKAAAEKKVQSSVAYAAPPPMQTSPERSKASAAPAVPIPVQASQHVVLPPISAQQGMFSGDLPHQSQQPLQTSELSFVNQYTQPVAPPLAAYNGTPAALPPAAGTLQAQRQDVVSPGKGRSIHDLPVFNSTGYIPFADTPPPPPPPQAVSAHEFVPQIYAAPMHGFESTYSYHPMQDAHAPSAAEDARAYDKWAISPDTPGR